MECSMSQPHSPWSCDLTLESSKTLLTTVLDMPAPGESLSVQLQAVWRELSAGTSQPHVLSLQKEETGWGSYVWKSWIFLQVLLDILLWQLLLQGEWSSFTPHPLPHPCLCPVPSPSYFLLRYLHGRCFSFKIYPWWENLPSASKYHLLMSANISLKFWGILVSHLR